MGDPVLISPIRNDLGEPLGDAEPALRLGEYPSAIKGGSDLLALRRLTFLGHENSVQTVTDMLGETPIKRFDLTLVGGSKCIQYGTPFLTLGQIDHQVEWLSQ